MRLSLNLVVVALSLLAGARSASAQSRLHDQWTDLAPIMSMDSVYSLDDLDALGAAQLGIRLAELGTMSFDAHPLLSQVGRPFVGFVVTLETRVVPTFRATEFSFEGLALQAFSEMAEQRILIEWQREFDIKARRAYGQLMPVARELAAPPSSGSFPLEVLSHGDYPYARVSVGNSTRASLTTLTIAADFIDIYGRRSPHYYFVPSLALGERYALRYASDWRQAGGGRTIAVEFEVLSDSTSTSPTRFTLNSVLRTAAQVEMQRIQDMVAYVPPEAINRIELIRPQVSTLRDVEQRLDAIRADAESLLEPYEKRAAQIEKWSVEIDAILERRVRAQKQLASATELRRQNIRGGIATMDARVARLREQIETLTSTPLQKPRVRASSAKPGDPETAAADALADARMWADADKDKYCTLLRKLAKDYPGTAAAEEAEFAIRIVCGG